EDQGIDVVFPHWRGVMGPKDMTPEQREYWDTTMEKVVKSKRWQEIRKNNDWENFYKDSEESEKFLKAQRKKYNELVNDSGLK
ncbi:tripartite tricarboxylate transporter substrate binding protein, partial [Mammaliicoccus sciuri]